MKKQNKTASSNSNQPTERMIFGASHSPSRLRSGITRSDIRDKLLETSKESGRQYQSFQNERRGKK